MSLISVTDLRKEFRLQKRKTGLWGAVQNLFNSEYEIKVAVNNISFEIGAGEIVGYIGPNGAGKSTTIKMLVGILVPTSGEVEVGGLVPYKNRIEHAKRMGVVFGQRTQLWWDIPVRESLQLMRYMYKISDNQYRANLELFTDILGIDKFIDIPVRQLSLGQRMRADLCAALLHNPEILYLDEPTIGLDVAVKEKIREFILEINRQRKTTVMLTTHDMSDIEKLCSRVMVIDHGQIIYTGSLEELKERHGTEETLVVDIGNELSDLTGLYALGVNEVKREGSTLSLKYDRRIINSAQLMTWLINQATVKNFVVHETEIETVIRKIV